MDDADRAQRDQEMMDDIRRRHQPTKRPMQRAMDWCIDCGERIDPRRLKVVHDAERCFECQGDYESYLNKYQ